MRLACLFLLAGAVVASAAEPPEDAAEEPADDVRGLGDVGDLPDPQVGDPAPAPAGDADQVESMTVSADASRAATLGVTLGTGAWTAVTLAGSQAELLAHDAVDEEHAEATLGALEATVATQIRYVDLLLADPDLPSDEAELLRSLRDVFVGVGDQTKHLRAYVREPDSATGKAFRDARASTWTALSEALGLDDKAAARLAPGGATLGKPKGH